MKSLIATKVVLLMITLTYFLNMYILSYTFTMTSNFIWGMDKLTKTYKFALRLISMNGITK